MRPYSVGVNVMARYNPSTKEYEVTGMSMRDTEDVLHPLPLNQHTLQILEGAINFAIQQRGVKPLS